MKLVTAQHMRVVEQAAVQRGVSLDRLMENAGLAVARVALERLAGVQRPQVLVLVGPGNNGSDGLVAARHLQARGASVTAYLCAARPGEDPKLASAVAQGITVVDSAGDSGLAALEQALGQSSMVIDAILGIGRSRPITGQLASMLHHVASARRRNAGLTVLALDIPTGLDADTGEVDPVCAPADLTVTLGLPKAGLFKFPGADYAGQLRVVDIGVPPEAAEGVDAPELVSADWVRSVLPTRHRDSHKGTFGRVLVVAGSQSYLGAAYLACMGAARIGAGYVTLAAPFRIQAIIAAKLTEATYLTLPERVPGSLSPESARVLRQAVSDYDVLLIGPGLGQHPATAAVVRNTLLGDPTMTTPVVVDADALNILAQTPDWWKGFKAPAVLTPHPGEMARLLGRPIVDVQQDRWALAKESAESWGVNVVLKGAFTVVASPRGRLRVSPFANPALASAGTGDVLAGVIAGLQAQGVPPSDAATAGVYLHGVAGELMRREFGDAGGIASDLLPLLPKALRGIREGSWADGWS